MCDSQQFYLEKKEGEHSCFADLICKLDRVLRLFKMVKASDFSAANEIRERAKNIMRQMESMDAIKYKTIQDKILVYINESLSQPPKKKAVAQPKVAAPAVSGAGKQDLKVSGSFGSIIEQRVSQAKQSSISLFPKSSVDASFQHKQERQQREREKQKERDKEKEKEKEKEIQKEKEREKGQKIMRSPEKQQPKFSIDFKKQSSAEMSGSLSDTFKTNSNLREYCQVNSNSIETKMVINQEVINYFKTQSADKVSLLGVQKPHDKNTDRLYICTYMEFMKEQVTSIKFKTKNYQNELDEFMNVLRYPLALCVIGQSISDMRIHYVKFLLEMTSPLPLVLIYNQVAPDKSLVVRMSDKVISNVDNCNIIQMDRLDSQINMKDKSKYKCTSLKEILVVKDKCVTTKPLYRKINHQIIENDQAIMIEKCKKASVIGIDVAIPKKVQEEPSSLVSLNSSVPSQAIDSINSIQVQEPSGPAHSLASEAEEINKFEFSYKIHSKFMTTVCTDFFVYLVTQEKEMLCRKKTKTLEESIEFVKNSKSLCVLGCTMKSTEKQIPSLLFTTQLKLLNICPMILIRLRNLNFNRAVFITVKPETTEEVLTSAVVNYKKVEENSCPFLRLLISGQKNELLCYETDKPIVQI